MRAALSAALAAAALLASPVAAHRGHSSLSVVEVDPATGVLTVTHRIAAHDAEPVLVRLAPDAQPSLDDPDALAALRRHGGEAFRVWTADGALVPLIFQRESLDGDDLRFVYRGRLPIPARALRVDSDLFVEAHDDQENQVNVRQGGVTRTLVFHAGTAPQDVTFGD